MPEEQKISPNEILAAAGASAPVTGGTFLQRTGLILAASVGALGSVVILLLVGKEEQDAGSSFSFAQREFPTFHF